MPTDSGLIQAYKDLITSQHRGKPKFVATVAELLKFSEDIYATAVYMDDEFDIDLANGAQEDVLGVIVGASRELGFQPHTQDTATLNDEDYRFLLKAKVGKNLWKGGIDDLQRLWHSIFNDDIIIIDNQDMTIEVQIRNVPSSVVHEMILMGYIVPKPQSVRTNYHIIREIDSQYWIGGGASQHTRAVIRMEYAKGATINATVYYGGVASQHTRAKIRLEYSQGGSTSSTHYYGAIPSQHMRTVLSGPKLTPQSIGATTFYGGQPSKHVKHSVRQPYSDGGGSNSIPYYGTAATIHRQHKVSLPISHGATTTNGVYSGGTGSIHRKTII